MDVPAMPQYLRDNREKVTSKEIKEHEAGGTVAQWARHFPTATAIKTLLERFGDGQLSRGRLFELGATAVGASSRDDRRSLLAATFIWGYRPSGRAYRNYGLADASPRRDEVLELATQALMQGALGAAYMALGGGLRAYGEALFTKYLYFFDQALDNESSRPKALILDSRVRGAITFFRRFHGMRWEWEGPYADRYLAYCATMKRWAEELQCQPDQIEMFLFQGP